MFVNLLYRINCAKYWLPWVFHLFQIKALTTWNVLNDVEMPAIWSFKIWNGCQIWNKWKYQHCTWIGKIFPIEAAIAYCLPLSIYLNTTINPSYYHRTLHLEHCYFPHWSTDWSTPCIPDWSTPSPLTDIHLTKYSGISLLWSPKTNVILIQRWPYYRD